MIPIVFPKVPEKGASDEEWTKYDKNLQDVITKYINDAIKKASDETTAVSDSIPEIASSAQAIAGIDNGTIISPLRMREGFNASGDAPVFACRAWVNFNGTTNTDGYCTIRASGNVASVADNGTGNYTITFTTALEDANYVCVGGGRRSADVGSQEASPQISFSNFATGSVKVGTQDNDTNTYQDCTIITVAVFR